MSRQYDIYISDSSFCRVPLPLFVSTLEKLIEDTSMPLSHPGPTNSALEYSTKCSTLLEFPFSLAAFICSLLTTQPPFLVQFDVALPGPAGRPGLPQQEPLLAPGQGSQHPPCPRDLPSSQRKTANCPLPAVSLSSFLPLSGPSATSSFQAGLTCPTGDKAAFF